MIAEQNKPNRQITGMRKTKRNKHDPIIDREKINIDEEVGHGTYK